MSLDRLDAVITSEPPDDEYCELHDIYFRPRRGVACPACAADEADRRYDAQREERV